MRSLSLNLTTSANNKGLKVLGSALMLSMLAAPSIAADQYIDKGRVLSVTPQSERVNVPRQECRTEYQQQSYNESSYRDGNRSIAGTVIGGIAGGLLGSTIGRGNGRVAAAAVGAGIGAIAGDRIGNRNTRDVVSTRTVPVQSCYQVDNWQTVNTGYLVTYAYNGKNYSTVTNTDPGQYIDVSVSVAPANQVVSNQTTSQINYIENIQYDNNRGDRDDRGWRNHRRHHDDERRYY